MQYHPLLLCCKAWLISPYLYFFDNISLLRVRQKVVDRMAVTWCQVAAVRARVTHHGHGQSQRLLRGRPRHTLSVFRRRECGGASPGRRERYPRSPAAPSGLPHALPAAAPLALISVPMLITYLNAIDRMSIMASYQCCNECSNCWRVVPKAKQVLHTLQLWKPVPIDIKRIPAP